MNADALFFLYVAISLSALGVVATYYELRRRRFDPAASEDNIFRCEKCGFVYTDDADVGRSRCPQCGLLNDTFRF
jgi:rubrerythrin